MSKNRVLLLSWEYPPVIEGGLARHVCKLAEALVRQGVAVDVLTRERPTRPLRGRVRMLIGVRARAPIPPRGAPAPPPRPLNGVGA
jgi:glycogen(starch) synthase